MIALRPSVLAVDAMSTLHGQEKSSGWNAQALANVMQQLLRRRYCTTVSIERLCWENSIYSAQQICNYSHYCRHNHRGASVSQGAEGEEAKGDASAHAAAAG